MADRDLREKIVCRISGKDTMERRSIQEAIERLDKLVWKMSNNFHQKVPHLDMDDLYQQGCLGIITAWQKFDPTKGTAFITYANWWIYKYIQNFCSAMEYSLTLNSQNQKLYKTLCMSQGSTHSVTMSASNQALAALAKSNTGLTKKLDQDEFSAEDDNLDVAETEESYSPLINKVLDNLKMQLMPREYYVVVASSGLLHDQPLSTQDISERLDVTEKTVKDILEKYSGMLRTAIESISGQVGNACLELCDGMVREFSGAEPETIS